MTPIEAGLALSISRDRVYDLIARGKIRGAQGPTGRWEVNERDVAVLALREIAPGLTLISGAR